MRPIIPRRQFLGQSATLLGLAGTSALAQPAATPVLAPGSGGEWPGFPQQDPALVREMVGASHGRIERVKELLAAHPALAKAAIDWGFGDWETALGAASHVGNREIAALLIDHGARPDLFTAAMLGMDDVVKAMLAARPALARTRGPHGISLLAHARAGKNDALASFLSAFDGAGDTPGLPITPVDMKRYLGEYTSSAGPVVISETRFGMAVRGGPAGIDRTLVRLAEHVFHPVGAPNVRVTFTATDVPASRVEIVEADWFVSATR